MKTNGRANVGKRIERDLDAALSRLRQLGGTVMVMNLPGTIGENSAFADEVDQIQVNASRDIGLATRELLQERANRLSAALDRLNGGAYGVCVECAEPIAPARLEAVPEVETCIRCQAGLERLGRQSASSRRSVFAAGQNETADEAAPPSYRSSLFPNEEDRSATS
jgi:DnaK suppressor protein